MAKDTAQDGREIEVLGTCMTQAQADTQLGHNVAPGLVWSYAQEEALIGVSEQGQDKNWRLVQDAERRAKRIAARYADLYFISAERSQGKVQFYWPALAAFVVKDIAEAYRYSRDEVLAGGWSNAARTSTASQFFSTLYSNASPYEHALRVYVALAKGNLWLFMDIYPWLYFFYKFGINPDGSLNIPRLQDHVTQRDASQYQAQSKAAVEQLPFGRPWLARQQGRQQADPVYTRAASYFDTQPTWSGDPYSGYGQQVASAMQAHSYVKGHIASYDNGYHLPLSNYWGKFSQAFYVMEEERKELARVANDGAASAALDKLAQFKVTKDIQDTYALLIAESKVSNPSQQAAIQLNELKAIAKQEQINILQPLIYNDKKLQDTMNLNHLFARLTYGHITTKYRVIYSAQPATDSADLQTVFDEPTGAWSRYTGHRKSLPDQTDRMEYVAAIAKDFHRLMQTRRAYMEGELQKIRGWLNA